MFLLYIPSTDTLEVVFGSEIRPVAETCDGPKPWMTVDFGGDGRLSSMTIEHALDRAPAEWIPALEQAEKLSRNLSESSPQIEAVVLSSDGSVDLEATYAINEDAENAEQIARG